MVSVRVYLEDNVRNEKGFRAEVENREGSRSLSVYSLGQLALSLERSTGEFFVELSGIEANIPEAVKHLATRISCRDIIPSSPARNRGAYKRGSATATVELMGSDRYDIYVFAATGNVASQAALAEAIDLYRKIRAGTVLPFPADNWEAEQMVAPPAAKPPVGLITRALKFLRIKS